MTDEEADQNLLSHMHAALKAGRLKAPKEPPSPAVAKRLHEFRQEFDCDVDVVSTTAERITAIVTPRDGSPRFFLCFDAASVGPIGRLQ